MKLEDLRVELMRQDNSYLEIIHRFMVVPILVILLLTILGLTSLTIPGDQDRRKQLAEISILIQQDAIQPQIPPDVDPKIAQQMQPQTTLQPEEKVDDHEAHIQTCKHWLNSEVGQYFKDQKPGKYMNVVLHMEAHQMMQQAEMMQSMMMNNPPVPQQGQQ